MISTKPKRRVIFAYLGDEGHAGKDGSFSAPVSVPAQAPAPASTPVTPCGQIERASPHGFTPKPEPVSEQKSVPIPTLKPATETQLYNDVSNIIFQLQKNRRESRNEFPAPISESLKRIVGYPQCMIDFGF